MRVRHWEPDGSFKLSDVQTGGVLATLPWIQNGVSRIIAFSPDGKSLAIYWNGSPTLHLWDVASQQPRAALPLRNPGATTGDFYALVFSPDGKTLAAGSQYNRLHLWNLASGEELVLQPSSRGTPITAIAFSADGRLVAAANGRGVVQLWEVARGRQWPATCRGHTDPIASMTFTKDGQTLVTSSEDGTIRFWDVQTGQERMTLTGHAGAVWSAQFSPDGQSLATGGEDRTVRLWLAATDEMARAFRDELDPTDAMAPSAGNSEGDNLSLAGRNEDAAAAYRRALARADVLMQRYPDNPVYVQGAAHSHLSLGKLLRATGDLAGARTQYEAALAIRERLAREHPAVTRYGRDLAMSHNFLGDLLRGTGDLAGARTQYEAALAIRERLAREHPTVTEYYNLGYILSEQKKLDEAIAAYRKAIELDPKTPTPTSTSASP